MGGVKGEVKEALRLSGADRLILGLSGYTDAGGVASFSSSFIVRGLQARRLGELEGGSFVYSSSRPTTVIRRGLVEEVRYPKGEVYLADEARVVVVKGEEPHLSWNGFLAALMELVEASGAREVYTLGGLIDFVEEPRVSAVVSLPELQDVVEACGARLIDYEGPCSVYTALVERCAREGLRAVSLWGHVPYNRYTALTQLRAPDLETSHRTLAVLCRLAKLSLPLDELKSEAERQLSFLERVREAGEEKPSKFTNYIY